MREYHSEADKVRDMPHVMQYVKGNILDIGAGHDRITPEAIGVDGRDLPGIGIVTDDIHTLWDTQRYGEIARERDTVFSSHFLEHVEEPIWTLHTWSHCLKSGGHLVLYMPEKDAYNSKDNPEHLYDWSYEDFLFAVKRNLCGEGKNFKGEHLPKIYDLIDSGLDINPEEFRYSFYLILRKP